MPAQSIEDKERAKAEAEFQLLTQNFHHLVSTRHIPGVFNPGYASANAGTIPSAYGVPLETHLRAGVKTYLHTATNSTLKKRPPPQYSVTRQTLRVRPRAAGSCFL